MSTSNAQSLEAAPRPQPSEGDAPGAGPAPRRRPPTAAIVAGIVALLLAGFGGRAWWYGRHHVSTDNAQVEGHILPILSRVSGYVEDVNVIENQSVAGGETLVRIDDRDLKARLAETEGELERELANAGTRGHTGQAAAQLAAARAAVTRAQAANDRAQADLARIRPLAERNIVSRQQLDGAVAAAASASAELDAAREQVAAARAGLHGAEARVEAARAARDQAALQLSYAGITAPRSGVVSQKNVEVGQFVQAGQALMSVVPLNDVWVVANLKETQVHDVGPGDKVDVTVDSYPGSHFAGHVQSLSAATGAKFSLLPPDNATGNFTKVVQRIPVRILLDAPPEPRHPLRPGMSVHVTITTS